MITRRQGMIATAALITATGTARAAAFDGLGPRLAAIEAETGGRLGIAVLDTGSGARGGHRQDERFAMASTFKASLVGAVLAAADAGRIDLDRRLVVRREALIPWSPVTETRIGAPGMTIAELCDATMTISDNTAANMLLDQIGGPAGLTAFWRGLGDPLTRLDRTEPTLNEALPDDPRDTTTPAAMLGSLHRIALGQVLSDAARARFQGWLRGNRTGDARLRAAAPPGWVIGDRTGTGARGTSNVIGIAWPPGGRPPLVITAYLTQGPRDGAKRDAALAAAGAAIFASLG